MDYIKAMFVHRKAHQPETGGKVLKEKPDEAKDKISGEGVPSKEKVDGTKKPATLPAKKKKKDPKPVDAVDGPEKAAKQKQKDETKKRTKGKQRKRTVEKHSKRKTAVNPEEAYQETRPAVDTRKMDGAVDHPDVKKEDEDKKEQKAKQPMKKPNKTEETEYEETAAPSRPAVDKSRRKSVAEMLAEAQWKMTGELPLDDTVESSSSEREGSSGTK